MKGVELLGACCNYGQKRYGPRMAPYAVEGKLGITMQKVKDDPTTQIFDYDLLYSTHSAMSQKDNIVTIGGDHSISYSTISSALKTYGDSLHVIWIDAHTDINTQSTSTSQNLHGMPVGHLMGFEKHPMTTFDHLNLDPSQITYIGIRDIDPPEYERLEDYKIEGFPINSFSHTITQYLKRRLQHKNIYLSIDVDSLDPREFPCTGTPVRNGMYMKELLTLVDTLKDNAVGMDIVEFDPLSNKKFTDTCLGHIEKLINVYI